MKRLDEHQREALADYYIKVSIMTLGAIVVGQFVADRQGMQVNWTYFIIGFLVALIFAILGIAYKRKRKPLNIKTL